MSQRNRRERGDRDRDRSDRDRGDRDRDRGDRDRGERRRGGGRHNDKHQNSEGMNRPIILAKPDRDRDFPTLQVAQNFQRMQLQPTQPERETAAMARPEKKDSRSESPASTSTASASHLMHLKTGRRETSSGRSDSPKTSSSSDPSKPIEASQFMSEKSVRIIDDQQFCETLSDYLSENSDFLVVGIVGPQSSGKSTIMNFLANGLTDSKRSDTDDESESFTNIFRVQNFERVMSSEHCTNGISAWISPRHRIILLDSQPVNAPSVLDRAIQLDKKFTYEFSTAESTIEVQSLQMIGFLMSICHVLILNQEMQLDISFIRFILRAELLKPSTTALVQSSGADSAENQTQVVEYFPEVIFLHNRCPVEYITDSHLSISKQLYSRMFARSQMLHSTNLGLTMASDLLAPLSTADRASMSSDVDKVNVFLLPDIEDDDRDVTTLWTFDHLLEIFRRKVFSVIPRPMSTIPKPTERQWLVSAQKSWETIKNFSYYHEYDRMGAA